MSTNKDRRRLMSGGSLNLGGPILAIGYKYESGRYNHYLCTSTDGINLNVLGCIMNSYEPQDRINCILYNPNNSNLPYKYMYSRLYYDNGSYTYYMHGNNNSINSTYTSIGRISDRVYSPYNPYSPTVSGNTNNYSKSIVDPIGNGFGGLSYLCKGYDGSLLKLEKIRELDSGLNLTYSKIAMTVYSNINSYPSLCYNNSLSNPGINYYLISTLSFGNSDSDINLMVRYNEFFRDGSPNLSSLSKSYSIPTGGREYGVESLSSPIEYIDVDDPSNNYRYIIGLSYSGGADSKRVVYKFWDLINETLIEKKGITVGYYDVGDIMSFNVYKTNNALYAVFSFESGTSSGSAYVIWNVTTNELVRTTSYSEVNPSTLCNGYVYATDLNASYGYKSAVNLETGENTKLGESEGLNIYYVENMARIGLTESDFS